MVSAQGVPHHSFRFIAGRRLVLGVKYDENVVTDTKKSQETDR